MSATLPNPSIWSDLRISRNIRLALALVLGFSIFVNLLLLTSPIYMMQVFDRVLVTGRLETLISLSIIALVALGVLGLLDAVRGHLLTRLGRFLDVALRDPVLLKALTMARHGEANPQRINEHLAAVRSFLGSPAVLPLVDAPWVPFFVVVIALLHPLLGVLAVVSALVLFGLAVANDVLSRKLLRQAAAQRAEAADFAGSAVLNAEVVHAMGMHEAVSDRFRKQVERMGTANQKAADIASGINATSRALRMAVQSAALGLGAYLVIRAELSPGGMIAASIVLGRALAPVEQAIGSWKQFLTARDAYAELKSVLEATQVEPDRLPLPDIVGRLSVEAATFRLPDASAPLLTRIGFVLEPGTALALVGPSASGKSSLCRLIVGAWEPTLGHVRLDGADVCRLAPGDVRRAIGYLPQAVELFAGTVKDNIARLGAPNDDAVLAAAMTAGCHEMILRLPQGYDTELGPRGAFISGGQRQRIALARALYGAPRLLVLDEPNSSLDQEGESALLDAMRAAKAGGATIVVVTHRTALLQPVDKIAVLREGQIERFGERDEVLRELAPRAVPQARSALAATGQPAFG